MLPRSTKKASARCPANTLPAVTDVVHRLLR